MANGMKGHIWPEGLSLPIPRDVGLIASKARLKPGDLTHTHDIKQEGRGENIALGQMKVWDYLSPPLSRNASKVFPACDAFKKKKRSFTPTNDGAPGCEGEEEEEKIKEEEEEEA